MKVGDLVIAEEAGIHYIADNPTMTGLVLAIIEDVEIPPLIEVMWDNGYVSRTYQDELKVLCKSTVNMVQ
jgi:hypothetical protein